MSKENKQQNEEEILNELDGIDIFDNELDGSDNSEEEKKALEEAKKELEKQKKEEKKKTKETKKTDIKNAVKVPSLSTNEILEIIKKDPKAAEEIKAALGTKDNSSDFAKLADAITSLVKEKGTEGVVTSNQGLQSALAKANNQAILNLENFKTKFEAEIVKGKIGTVFIDPAYSSHLPTRSFTPVDGKKVTQFEIGLNGIIFTFKINVEYTNVPQSIALYVNRKIAKYISVVSSKTTTEKSKAAFDIRENAAR